MKTITVDDFWAMTTEEKDALVKKHLNLAVSDGFKICGYDQLTIVVGNTSAKSLETGTAWPCKELNFPGRDKVKILSKYPFYLFAITASLAAINKANEASTSKTD